MSLGGIIILPLFSGAGPDVVLDRYRAISIVVFIDLFKVAIRGSRPRRPRGWIGYP